MQIFVGNLAFTAPVDDVRQLFEPYGEIVRVHLPEDRETGRPRGFGFVEMPNNMEARAAIAGLHGKDLGGRSLVVNEARPREERDGQRGGPRRGPRW
jgi:cold-inducible RNA-binding protein